MTNKISDDLNDVISLKDVVDDIEYKITVALANASLFDKDKSVRNIALTSLKKRYDRHKISIPHTYIQNHKIYADMRFGDNISKTVLICDVN